MVLSSRNAASATRALNSGVWVRRTRRATVAFFFSFIMKIPISPACAGPYKIAWISTYPTVQIRRTTSPRQITLSKNYRFGWRKFLLQALLLATYFLAFGATLFFLASVFLSAGPSQTLNAAFVAAASATVCYLSLVELRSISAALRLMSEKALAARSALPPIAIEKSAMKAIDAYHPSRTPAAPLGSNVISQPRTSDDKRHTEV